MLEDNDDQEIDEIPLTMINTQTLNAVVEYCTHFKFEKTKTDIPFPITSNRPSEFIKDQWEAKFITQFNLDQVIQLLQAANFLNIPPLFELCCATIASEFKSRNFDEVKKRFGLDDVFYTPEEEEKIKKENPWIITETEEKIKKLINENPLQHQN